MEGGVLLKVQHRIGNRYETLIRRYRNCFRIILVQENERNMEKKRLFLETPRLRNETKEGKMYEKEFIIQRISQSPYYHHNRLQTQSFFICYSLGQYLLNEVNLERLEALYESNER